MATKKQVTEPAEAPVTEPAEAPATDQQTEPARSGGHRIPNPEARSEMVRVRDADTGEILPNRVPRNWLDGRFPQLKEVPSNKKGK